VAWRGEKMPALKRSAREEITSWTPEGMASPCQGRISGQEGHLARVNPGGDTATLPQKEEFEREESAAMRRSRQ